MSTAFGHELVHRYNEYRLSPDLYRKGIITAQQRSFPFNYNESLSHYWSYNYSGLGGSQLRAHISMSSTLYKGIMQHFNNHKIDTVMKLVDCSVAASWQSGYCASFEN